MFLNILIYSLHIWRVTASVRLVTTTYCTSVLLCCLFKARSPSSEAVGSQWGNSPDPSSPPIDLDLTGSKLSASLLHIPYHITYFWDYWSSSNGANKFFKRAQLPELAVKSDTSSKVMDSALHLEGITVGYSWTHPSPSEQEMAYFSWGDPVPAREVANHMKLAPSSLFTHSNLHRWERMGCWGFAQQWPCLAPPPPGNRGPEFIPFIGSTPRPAQLLSRTCRINILKQFYK